ARNAIEAGVWSIERGRALTDDLLRMMKGKDMWRVGTDGPFTPYRGSQAAFDRTVDRLKAAYRIGVRSVFSTDFDYYVPGMTRGDEVIDALITWKAAGIPPRDILKAMTTYGYQVTQVEHERGPIKPGLAADMIAVAGDPLAMEHVVWLADVYGPRVTGSPGLRQAGDWAVKKLGGWGLSNVHKEAWPFGKGWSLVRFNAHLIEPQVQPLIGYPKSWTPGTSGVVTADVVRADINSDADFERYRGKLARKIVLTQPAREVRMLEGIVVQRWTDALLKEAESTPPGPPAEAPARPSTPGQPTQQERIQQFLLTEGVVAAFDRGADAFLVAGDNQMS